MPATVTGFEVVPVDKPAEVNVIIGQAHFIKTVEDLHEVLAGVSSQLRFGIAFVRRRRPGWSARPATTPS